MEKLNRIESGKPVLHNLRKSLPPLRQRDNEKR